MSSTSRQQLRLSARASSGEEGAFSTGLDGSLGELIDALADALGTGGTDRHAYSARLGLWLDRTMAIAQASLVHGDELRLAPAKTSPGADVGGDRLYELAVVAGPSAGKVFPLGLGDFIVGRDPSCDVTIDDPSISRKHLTVRVSAEGVAVADRDSRNGSAIDGVGLRPHEMHDLDHGTVELGRTLIAARRRGTAETAVGAHRLIVPFNRPPRVRQPSVERELEVPAPPSKQGRVRVPLAGSLVPLLLGVALWLLTSQIEMLLFSALSPVMAVTTFITDRRSGKRSYAGRLKAYREALATARAQQGELQEAEQRTRHAAAPDPDELRRRACEQSPNVWERRLEDEDFLNVRLGLADQPSTVQVVMDEGGEAALREEAADLLGADRLVPSVPVTVNLRTRGTLGISGDAEQLAGLARWLVVQLCTLHSPRDLRLCVALSPQALDDWDWTKWLPHLSADSSPLDLAPVAVGSLEARELLLGLRSLIAQRQDDAQPGRRKALPGPHYVVFIDHEAAAERALVSEILANGPAHGVSVVWLGGPARDLPGECAMVAEHDPAVARLSLTDVANGDTLEDVSVDGIATGEAELIARALAPLRDVTASDRAHETPTTIGLLDCLGLADVTAETVQARWDDAPDGVTAIIGMRGADPLAISLRDDGPHGLIAGTTGAGKSELLQTLVAALAATHGPDRLNFVLIDYKGGATFKDCARLPHTVGLVTDLDGHLTQRALVSLNAELRRRESILRDRGVSDLASLEGPGSDAPARLVIIIDEFAALAREMPEFIDGLVDVAQRGRSLGIHLLLATQRPAGVVSENIRANSNLRIALRVATPVESEDVIAAPDAAKIPRGAHGRAFLRTGHSELTEFQVAHSGHVRSQAVDAPVVRVEPLHLKAAAGTAMGPAAGTGTTDLELLGPAIRGAATRAGLLAPPPPWLPPLPEVVTLDDLDGEPDDGPSEAMVVGVVDEPAMQAQRILTLDLHQDAGAIVFGVGGSGKTTLLRTMTASLARRYSPERVHVYALDFASRALAGIEVLPHVGSVIFGEDEERVERLLRTLARSITERKDAFVRSGSFNLAEHRAKTGEALPRVLVLLDSYAGFNAAFERVNAGELVDLMPRLISEGRSVGIHFVLTAERRSEIPGPIAGSIATKLVLKLADENEYGSVGLDLKAVKGARLPPGRGFTAGNLEFQAAVIAGDGSSLQQDLALQELAAKLEGPGAPAIATLPEVVHRADLPAETRPLHAPLGLADQDLAVVSADLSEGHFLVGGPYRSGRSTTLLTVVAGLVASTPGATFVLMAPRRTPLADEPCFAEVASGLTDCADLATSIAERIAAGQDPRTPLIVVIDDAAELAESTAGSALETIVRRGRDGSTRIVASVEAQAGRVAFAPWLRDLRRDGNGFLLDPDPDLDGDLLGVRVPSLRRRLPTGRGFLVRRGVMTLAQVAS